MSSERKVPVHKNENSLIDSEFNSIRARFEDDMRKMEDEMTRFRSHLMDRERGFFNSSDSSLIGRTSRGSNSGSWIDSPLVQDTDDGKVLKLRFDVTQYAPEEIVVKTIDNRLQVHAKHEEKSDSKSVYREYNREFLLPKGTNPEAIRSTLSKDGVLTVEAPLPIPQLTDTDKRIPIQHK